ncbi:MAG: protein kinase [Gammaproteobacteria bacterium]|nr:protein kinase [Gammaproteobacteria bacterium]MBU1491256.1 protein kinase [Gammaproteobacteria bacterium]MBU2140762.1 protein kinase [Gammaproteobacteria bacterium]MBU2216739.1 protein kinase [Gammaproteobacteria bacterium]
MSTDRLSRLSACLAHGQGLDLPGQAARVRAQWLPGREGRGPLLLVALLWARECADVVRVVEQHLDALFADFACTPSIWSEAQAARQVLAALNQQLYTQGEARPGSPLMGAGLLLVQEGEAQFLQAGAIGLLRYHGGSLQSLAGREDLALGQQAELALVQHSLPLSAGQVLVMAPQPLFGVVDLTQLGSACQALAADGLDALLAPLLRAPGAVAALLLQMEAQALPLSPLTWPPVEVPIVGQVLDGWTLTAACAFGPPGRVFRAQDAGGREALLWLSEKPADDAFWQHEWAMRRSRARALASVLSSRQPRCHAMHLFQAPPAGVRSLASWRAARETVDAARVLALLDQAIEAVRALQRRGMQGLLLAPRSLLVSEAGQLWLFPEQALLLPGVPPQTAVPELLPLAPEAREGRLVDGRADQFALAALVYWLLCGQWPEIARPEGGRASRYVPLSNFTRRLPPGWDGVLARALAPQPEARFAALSEFRLALQSPAPRALQPSVRREPWRLALLGVLMVQLGIGLLLSLGS